MYYKLDCTVIAVKNIPVRQNCAVAVVIQHCQLDAVEVVEDTDVAVDHKEQAVVVQNDQTVDSPILPK